MITLRNLISAYAIAGHGCEVIKPRITFSCGLIYFDCSLDDAVRIKQAGVVRLFIARIMFPLALLSILSLIWKFAFHTSVPGFIWTGGLLWFYFTICPLVHTDLHRLFHYINPNELGVRQSAAFLTNHFFVRARVWYRRFAG